MLSKNNIDINNNATAQINIALSNTSEIKNIEDNI